MSPATEHFVLQVLKTVLASLEEHRQVLFANRWTRLVGHLGKEDLVHIVSQIGDRFGFGRGRDLFQERLSEVTLLLLRVEQERIRLEVIHLLVCLVDCADFNGAALPDLIESHV